MEPKKIKKLVIKKETISVLNDYEQSMQKGGRASWEVEGTCWDWCTYSKYFCSLFCTDQQSCNLTDCIPTPSGFETYCPC